MREQTNEKKLLTQVSDLKIEFTDQGREEVVRGISFPVYEGEILGVVGESGSGKSMTALSLMGLLPESARIAGGSVLFQDREGQERELFTLGQEEMRQIQGREIAMVFQEPMTSLNPVMKIGPQVGENLKLHTSLSREAIKERSAEALRSVGLSEAESLMERYPHELSGGMRQRVMIAQAIVASPRLLIADEPTTALDVIVQAQILRLLRSIHEEQNLTILFISHDLNVIRQICDRVLVMYQGEIVEQGAVEEVFTRPKHQYTKTLTASLPDAEGGGETGTEILHISHLNVYYTEGEGLFRKTGRKQVLRDVSLSAYEGEILGLVGESGCGKSTLSKTITGLNRDFEGEISMAPGLRPQMVFQDPFSSLNPAKRIGWILEEPLKVRGIRDRQERKKLVARMLTDIGLDPSFAERRPRELSGGQRQRISIGTALLADSRMLVADEPVSALDVTVQSQILSLLLTLHRERKDTLLFVSHDLNVVRHICSRVAVLYLGEVVEQGLVEEIYRHPAHPYTKLLLEAGQGAGQIPDMGESFSREEEGCPFCPRCASAGPRCRSERPGETCLGEGHRVRCFLHEGGVS